MCGRFAFYSPREAVLAVFGVEFPQDFAPRYNIAPTQDVAAIRCDAHGARQPAMLRWGLIPSWARDPAIGNRMINARGETLAEKPAFRSAFRRRRCLVLASGFYEWRGTDRGKQPYYIAAADGRPIAFAGLWERWEKGERPVETCTIVTTGANRVLRELHDRMPVILAPEAAIEWLAQDAPAERLAGLLQPAADELLAARPVSRAVNSPAHEGPELIVARIPEA
jgi:putative SOS response-associated peptidase YedK